MYHKSRKNYTTLKHSSKKIKKTFKTKKGGTQRGDAASKNFNLLKNLDLSDINRNIVTFTLSLKKGHGIELKAHVTYSKEKDKLLFSYITDTEGQAYYSNDEPQRYLDGKPLDSTTESLFAKFRVL